MLTRSLTSTTWSSSTSKWGTTSFTPPSPLMRRPSGSAGAFRVPRSSGGMLTVGAGVSAVLPEHPTDVEQVVASLVNRVLGHPLDRKLLAVSDAAPAPCIARQGFDGRGQSVGRGSELVGDGVAGLGVVRPLGHRVVASHGRDLGPVLGDRFGDAPVV